jgi:Zn-dependent M28 family amino/carboxypeptidase
MLEIARVLVRARIALTCAVRIVLFRSSGARPLRPPALRRQCVCAARASVRDGGGCEVLCCSLAPIVLICSGEEQGLLGSRALAARWAAAKEPIVAMVNADMLGCARRTPCGAACCNAARAATGNDAP